MFRLGIINGSFKDILAHVPVARKSLKVAYPFYFENVGYIIL